MHQYIFLHYYQISAPIHEHIPIDTVLMNRGKANAALKNSSSKTPTMLKEEPTTNDSSPSSNCSVVEIPSSHNSLPNGERFPLQLKQEARELFVFFVKALLKHLAFTDKSMFLEARIVIRICNIKHKDGCKGYSILSIQIQKTLRRLVGSINWMEARNYVRTLLMTRYVESGKYSYEQARVRSDHFATQSAQQLHDGDLEQNSNVGSRDRLAEELEAYAIKYEK
ncbi:predicted protein [Chaetoceros tenuissimus]|uniref:Uncharacterized protein n=1 Tax=Chaetoceros tenuissimus TaxID=426638 RepID=A0AAD3HDT6_9STRA|nr:predicted protein [Chaetoceros tenuissimus]